MRADASRSMRLARLILALTYSAFLACIPNSAFAQDKIKVVATFSILADFVKNVGGDFVDVTAVCTENSIQPRDVLESPIVAG